MKIQIERICVPTDFTEASDEAIQYGAGLAHVHQAELHLLHILEHNDAIARHPDFLASGEMARAYFNEMQVDALDEAPRESDPEIKLDTETHQFLRRLEAGVETELEKIEQETPPWWKDLTLHRAVRYGRPAEEVCRYAQHYLIDLIVMPTHARRGIAKWLMGSVTDRVVRASPCPVVVLRFPAHEYKLVEHD